jgi:hypothetical protein
MGRSHNSFTSWVGTPHTFGGRNSMPEERLFSAVLSQAVHDVFSEHVEKLDKQQAEEFLTQNTWHFKMICELAGRDPDYVTRKMKKRMQEDTPLPFFSKARKTYRQANT